LLCASAVWAQATGKPTGTPAPEKKEAQAPPAPATPAAPVQKDVDALDLPVDTILLGGFVLSCLVWLAGVNWINRDGLENMIHRANWTLAMYVVGIVGLIGIHFLHGQFVWGMLGGLILVIGLYIRTRNEQVHPSNHVWTLSHIDRKLWHVLSGLRLIRLSKAAEAGRALQHVTLKTHDGVPADQGFGRARGCAPRGMLMLKELITRALAERATEVFLDPKPTEIAVRLRMDGLIRGFPAMKASHGAGVVAWIKVLAALDPGKKNVAQHGSFSADVFAKHVELRVAVRPGAQDEAVALRVLNPDAELLRLDRLGMRPDLAERMKAFLHQPKGLCLVCGPAESGRKTTLFAAMMEVDARARFVLSIENVIEYRLPNVVHTPVNPKGGAGYGATLRAGLRKAPNIIVLGDIPDVETAQTAMNAAAGNHLVLAAMQGTDTVSALFRLLALKVDPQLIAASVRMIIAQRLVRVLCADCRASARLTPDQMHKVGIIPGPSVTLFKPVGCSHCYGMGFLGRTGVFEVLDINQRIREMLLAKPTPEEIRQEARRVGFVTLMEDGLKKVACGATSLDEMTRALRPPAGKD
jgi:type II secretory ATPase GspE/PulE/Tfp pilus assembly ATPase PilB-like protein